MKFLLKSIIIASAMVAASATLATGACDNTPVKLINKTGHVLEVKRVVAVEDHSTISGPTEGKTIQPGETATWIIGSLANSPYTGADGYLILLDKSTQTVHDFLFTTIANRFSDNLCKVDYITTYGADTYTARNEHTASMQIDFIAK